MQKYCMKIKINRLIVVFLLSDSHEDNAYIYI